MIFYVNVFLLITCIYWNARQTVVDTPPLCSCHLSVARVSPACHLSVARLSPVCHRSVARVSPVCHRSVARVSPVCHRSFARVSPLGHRSVARVSPVGHRFVARVSPVGHRFVSVKTCSSVCVPSVGGCCTPRPLPHPRFPTPYPHLSAYRQPSAYPPSPPRPPFPIPTVNVITLPLPPLTDELESRTWLQEYVSQRFRHDNPNTDGVHRVMYAVHVHRTAKRRHFLTNGLHWHLYDYGTIVAG